MARTGLSGRLERRPQGGVEPARTCPALRWKISRRVVVGIECRAAATPPIRTPRRDELSRPGPRAGADHTGPEAASRRTGYTKPQPRPSGGGGNWAEAASAATRAGRRLRRRLMSLQEKMRQMRHLTIGQQVDELNDALRGHYGYYGIAGNFRALQKVYRHVERYWCGMLRSRCWAGRRLTWTDFNQLKEKIPLLRPKLRLP